MFALMKQRMNCKLKVKLIPEQLVTWLRSVCDRVCFHRAMHCCCVCFLLFFGVMCGFRVYADTMWVCCCPCALCTFIAVTCTSLMLSDLASTITVHISTKSISGNMLIFKFSLLPGTVWPIRPWLQGTRLSLFALSNWLVVDRCRHSAKTSYCYLCHEIPCAWPWQLTCCATLESIQPIDEFI